MDSKIHLKYETNNSFDDIFDPESPLTLLDLFMKNSSIELNWETGEFLSSLKEFLLNA